MSKQYSIQVQGWTTIWADSPEEAMEEADATLGWVDLDGKEVIGASELIEDANGHLVGGEIIYKGERS